MHNKRCGVKKPPSWPSSACRPVTQKTRLPRPLNGGMQRYRESETAQKGHQIGNLSIGQVVLELVPVDAEHIFQGRSAAIMK